MSDYTLCTYDMLNDLRRYMFDGSYDIYDTKLNDIEDILLKQMYHLGVHKMNDGYYNEAIRLFTTVRSITKSADDISLSLLRESICYLRMGDYYAGDVVYDRLVNSESVLLATNAVQCEFYFLIAYFGLERNRDIGDIVECIGYAYKAGRRFGSYCEGFFNVIQTAKEVAIKKMAYDLVYMLNLIIDEVCRYGSLTDEQKKYLEEVC